MIFSSYRVDIALAPQFSCVGFDSPFDNPLALKKKSKRAIPVKMALLDGDELPVIDTDIVAPPVVTVSFEGSVFGDVPPDTDELLPLGAANDDNVFRFDPDTGEWVYNLGTKQFAAVGTYSVNVVSGDTDEYVINPSCSQTFERLD